MRFCEFSLPIPGVEQTIRNSRRLYLIVGGHGSTVFPRSHDKIRDTLSHTLSLYYFSIFLDFGIPIIFNGPRHITTNYRLVLRYILEFRTYQ